MARVFALLVGVVAVGWGACARGPLVGRTAPEFTLLSVEAKRHSLSDYKGRVVVLEWTSHVCPAVASYENLGVLPDTRRACGELGAVWLAIDSSHYCEQEREGIAAWRAWRGQSHPYLLDPTGKVGEAYHATATPQVFVIGKDGGVVYSGAIDVHEGDRRRNVVIDAVRAAAAGRSPGIASTQAQGCSVKYGDPGQPMHGELREWADERRPLAEAGRLAKDGEFDAAMERLRQAVSEYSRPYEMLRDPAFGAMLRSDEHRMDVARLLRDHPATGRVAIVTPDEPGEPMVILGTVRDEAGEPVAGALIRVFHTDAAGWYVPGTTNSQNPRLFGWLRTDQQGRYRVRTIMPGAYADAASMPMHVHFEVRAEGFEPVGGVRGSVYFDDDPRLDAANRSEAMSDGSAIRTRERNAEGVTLVRHDIVLTRK